MRLCADKDSAFYDARVGRAVVLLNDQVVQNVIEASEEDGFVVVDAGATQVIERGRVDIFFPVP